MKVYYSIYTLTPLKRANRLSSMDPKPGVYLKGVLGNTVTYADYFPHLPLGDRCNEVFLEQFKYQNEEYDQKIFDFLLKDKNYQKNKIKPFKNHQLWTGVESIEAPVVKYKMTYALDRTFLTVLEKGLKLRMDANALFGENELKDFIQSIPVKYHSQIDYLEDPLKDKDWKSSTLPCARDFIEGTPFDFYIYKPNCEFLPKTDAKVIYSSYLGADLGRWHTYCEMVNAGDLNLTHGIISQGFCQEENFFYEGSYQTSFIPNMSKVHAVYQAVHDSDWKLLCSM